MFVDTTRKQSFGFIYMLLPVQNGPACFLRNKKLAMVSSRRTVSQQMRHSSTQPLQTLNCQLEGNGTKQLLRQAQAHRKTAETQVSVNVLLDGQGVAQVDTGIPFLDHMLCQISSHGLLDLQIRARGDLHIDDHHTNEDIGITLGVAIRKALGDKRGIQRFGHFIAPLDEALVQVVLDFSGRPYCNYGLQIPTQRVGTYDTQLVREFYSALATNGEFTLHIRQLEGLNSHHIIEASFKAFARALRMAIEYDPRRLQSIPSSKGSLSHDTCIEDLPETKQEFV